MAPFSLAYYSSSFLHLSVKYSSTNKLPTANLCTRNSSSPITTAALSEKPSASLLSDGVTPPNPTNLTLRKVPGDYGLPLIGPWRDRQDYFYEQGKEKFFKSRIQKYQSTVFRVNMPPGPFISFASKVVALLDGNSFPALFDTDKVEKKDLFTGTYTPSPDLTGGFRTLSFLDPSEPNHARLKKLLFFLLSHRREYVIPEFHDCYSEAFERMEKEISEKGKSDFSAASEHAAFNFLTRAFYGVNPNETKLGSDGPTLIGKWVLFHLHPLLCLGLPRGLEDGILHTFPLPPFLIKKDYQRLYEFFHQSSTLILDHAEKMGISRDEACHNLVFATCFNSFGGMKILFPNILKWVGRAGAKLHGKLASEIRAAVNSSDVTMAAMAKMPLMNSVVYEALRIEPPVTSQYGRAKRDFVIESHESAFQIKEGELLFGYQPLATRDPKIFRNAEEFVPDRFVGEEGERLLKHVLWSNGQETAVPTVNDKQCAGKDFVVLTSRLLLVEFFLRYDSFGIDVKPSPLGSTVTITSFKRASF